MSRARIHSDKTGGSGFEKALVAISLVIITGIVAVCVGVYIYRRQARAGVSTVSIRENSRRDVKPLVDAYMRAHPDSRLKYGQSDPDIVIGPEEIEGWHNYAFGVEPPLELKAGDTSVLLREGKSCYVSFEETSRAALELEGYLEGCLGNRPASTLTAVGDLIPGRTVAKMMALKGVNYPFEAISPYIVGADVVLANLECPLSDRVEPPYEGLSFIAPANTLDGIKLCGINVVSLANNHSANFGAGAFLDTLDLLESNGIKHPGGGGDRSEAYAPVILEAGGEKFAFLAYNSVPGSMNATDTRPGVTWVRMKPWSEDVAADREMVANAVKVAKDGGSIVVVYFHWGVEESNMVTDSQRDMAHAACDAGADLVIGGHPHRIQGVEFYKGSFIAYSLGNFVFDQMQHDYLRRGVILKCRFSNGMISGLTLVPYEIEDWCRPVALAGDRAQSLLDELLAISGLK